MDEFWNNFDVHLIDSAQSIDEAGLVFYESMNRCIELYVTSITPKNYSTNHPPWFNSELINQKNKRDKARKRIAISGNTEEYKRSNNEFIEYNNMRIAEYHTEQNSLCKSNPKKFWEFVN